MNKQNNCGVNIGTIIAVCLSYNLNQNIWWCIIHGMFGWVYVIYYVIKYGNI